MYILVFIDFDIPTKKIYEWAINNLDNLKIQSIQYININKIKQEDLLYILGPKPKKMRPVLINSVANFFDIEYKLALFFGSFVTLPKNTEDNKRLIRNSIIGPLTICEYCK